MIHLIKVHGMAGNWRLGVSHGCVCDCGVRVYVCVCGDVWVSVCVRGCACVMMCFCSMVANSGLIYGTFFCVPQPKAIKNKDKVRKVDTEETAAKVR